MTTYVGALVSAIITTHNRANLLPRAINSVLQQTYRNIEIIIVDDGSRDCTKEIVCSYQKKHPQIRYLRNEIPKGGCAARNFGIREAKGEFVAGLDDDDEWFPRRIEVLLGNFHDKYAYLCSQDLIITRNKKATKKDWPLIITLEDMLYKNLTGNQVLTKRERILAVGGFDENLTSAQDYDLWLRLLEKYGSAKRVPEVLQILYRDHETKRVSLSRGKKNGEWCLYKKYKAKMSKRQRRVHLIELKRIKGKRLRLSELPLISNRVVFRMFRHLLYYSVF